VAVPSQRDRIPERGMMSDLYREHTFIAIRNLRIAIDEGESTEKHDRETICRLTKTLDSKTKQTRFACARYLASRDLRPPE
jgi:hypothetical protein